MNRAVVSLEDERQLRGVVERFDPALPDFILRLDDGAPCRLRFADVRSVGFLSDSNEPLRVETGIDRLVTVRFFDGESVRGVLSRHEAQGRGVHLVPVEAGGVARWYVPISAIRDVVSVLSLGDILLREGMVTPDAIAAAVVRQRELRSQRLGDILKARGAVSDEQVARAVELQSQAPGKRIGDVLLEIGFVSTEQLAAAVQVQIMLRDKRLGEVLVDMGFADNKTIGIALALQFHLPFVTVSAGSIDPELRRAIPSAFARRWRLLPLELQRGVLTVAVADPTRLDFKSDLRNRTGMVITEAVATPEDVERGLAGFYGSA